MHRSKLAGFIIDCQTQDLEGAAHFWGSALGLPVTSEADSDPGYRHLQNAPGDCTLKCKRWNTPAACTWI